MQSVDDSRRNKKLKHSRSPILDMPLTESTNAQEFDASLISPVYEIVQNPLPGYATPASFSFSPDDNLVAYLFSPDQTFNRKVFAFDLKTREVQLLFSPPDGGLDESSITAEEKLRRERLRERGIGVTRYEWVKMSSKRRAIMVPLPTGIYFQDITEAKLELKLPRKSSSPIIDPHLSPDSTMLAYVRDCEVHVLNLISNESKKLTYGCKGNALTHGLAEYIAQEEMDRNNGYWWSRDSKYIAFTEVDFLEVPLYRIMHLGKSSVGSEAQEDHPYPFAGASNVKVHLGVVSVAGGPITWMDVQCGGTEAQDNEEEYLARVYWMPGNILTAQVLNRSQTKLKILKFNIRTGQRNVILVEEHTTWVNLHDCFTPLDKGVNRFSGEFLWASEKTGYRHLYLYDSYGTCLGSITEGEWMIEQIVGIDQTSELIYFMATIDSPLESHLYCAKLYPDTSKPLQAPVRLTQGKGKHHVVVDHHLRRFIDIHDSLDCPPNVMLCSLEDGSLIMPLFEQPVAIPRFKRLQLDPPEIIPIHANDGTMLFGALYKPDCSRFGPPPYKTMIYVYGGPSVQLVCDSWISVVDMRAQYLRNQGILVWKLDNRGTARRGLKFEGAVKHNIGRIDAEDQLAGAEWLIKQGFATAGQIGVYGWSYGGYLSAMILARFPHIFQCAVAGAPVSSWDGYDTFYTEKYMGLPNENLAAYEDASIMKHVHKMKGKLLLIHGMIDENVHFRHTARLVNALVAAGKSYELLVFPDERHMPRRHRDLLYLEERIWDFVIDPDFYFPLPFTGSSGFSA